MEIEKPQNNNIEQIIDKFHDLISEDQIIQAEGFLLENIKQFPNNDDLLYELGYFYYQQEDIEKAEQWLLKSIEINPENNPEKYFTLANLYQNQKSISLYEYGIQIAKNDLKQLNEQEQQNLRRLICQAYCSIFQILQETESSENLIELINQSQQIDPISLEPYQLLLSYHFNNIDEINSRKTVNSFIEKLKEMQTNDLDEEFANYDVND